MRGQRLISERIYDDPESYTYEKWDPADVVTPEMAREQLAPFLARATLEWKELRSLSAGSICKQSPARSCPSSPAASRFNALRLAF
jgi:hypothetical protein